MLNTEPQPLSPALAPAPSAEVLVRLSDAAAGKLRELTEAETNPAIGLRVYVYSGGCSGYRYGMMLEDQPTSEDVTVESQRRPRLRRPGQHPVPDGLGDRLRRHAHGCRLHGQQPERGLGLRLRQQLPDRRVGRQPGRLQPLTHSRRRGAADPAPRRR